MTKQPTPSGLLKGSAKLWADITTKYVMRSDELRILEDACREMDLVDRMQDELTDAPMTTIGSQGQNVPNPLLSEIRQHRAMVKTLIASLKLPDDGAGDSAGAISSQARAAANARWSKRGA